MPSVVFRSTKGASKARRDLINGEIANLRECLPLPEAARQRLSQLQVMSLSCCYIRKSNYFAKLFGKTLERTECPQDMAQAMTGFLLVCTRDGKLLYISENVTEFLGHSMVDMLTQGDSVYDIIDKRDHQNVQSQLMQEEGDMKPKEEKTFFCRMNVSRSFRRQAGFGDYKVMHIRGHFVQTTRDHYGNQPIFMALCTPLITPEVKETAVQNDTNMFHSVHGLDMKVLEIAPNGEHHLGYTNEELMGKSWYELLHPEDLQEAKDKHVQLIRSSHEMGCMLTVRLLTNTGGYIWVNVVMHIRQPFMGDNGEPAVVCINHVIDEKEANLFKLQSQLYSSHITRSPEYLAPPSGMSPSHAITQMEATHSMQMTQMSDISGSFSVSASSSSMMNDMGSEYLDSLMGATDHSMAMPKDPKITSKPPLSPREQKQRVSAGVLDRLKRKLCEINSQQQCKPSKIPKRSQIDHHDNNSSNSLGQTGSIGYTVDIESVVAPVSDYFPMSLMSSLDNGPCLMQLQGTTNDVLPAIKNPKVALDHFQSPLTPDSIVSSGDETMTPDFQSLNVDVHDTAIVPDSILTPAASPLYMANSPADIKAFNLPTVVCKEEMSPMPLPTELEEMSVFSPQPWMSPVRSPPAVPVTKKPKVNALPELDTITLEEYFADVEQTIKKEVMKLEQAKSVVVPQPEPVIPATTSIPPECLQMSDEQLTSLVSTVTDYVLDIFQQDTSRKTFGSNDFAASPESLMGMSVGSPGDMAEVPCMDDFDLQNSPLNEDILFELHQLNQLDAKPSYGERHQSRATINQTL